ncbi:hypothetical protein A2U01_0047050, partial [Trifolium medium]|nr:hypothetical protein [Trifolium medium]
MAAASASTKYMKK